MIFQGSLPDWTAISSRICWVSPPRKWMLIHQGLLYGFSLQKMLLNVELPEVFKKMDRQKSTDCGGEGG